MELLDKAINLPGNTKAMAECRRRRGCIQMRSDPGGAVKDFESAQAIYEALPQAVETTFGIAKCVSNVAESKRLLSEDPAATSLFKKALDSFAQAKRLAATNTRDEKITRGEAFCYQRLGALAQGNMQYDEVRAEYNYALMLFADVGDLIWQALCKKAIGDLEMLSAKNMALISYHEALRLFEEAQFERGTADCRYSLGDLAFSSDDYLAKASLTQPSARGKNW